MAQRAWSSIAAQIRAHRSSAVSSRLSLLPGQLQLLVLLMVSSALRAWSIAESISLPPSRRWASRGKFAAPLLGSSSSERDRHLCAERGAEPCELLAPPALGDADVLGDLRPAGEAGGGLWQEASHLKFQAQVTGTPLQQGQQLGVGDEVLQRRQPDLAGRVEGDGQFADASGMRGPLACGA